MKLWISSTGWSIEFDEPGSSRTTAIETPPGQPTGPSDEVERYGRSDSDDFNRMLEGEVRAIFAGSRKFAEEWAYPFFGAAVADHTESSYGPPLMIDFLRGRDVMFEPNTIRWISIGPSVP